MIKLIPIKYRIAVARWLLSGEGPIAEHKIVHHDAQTLLFQSQHKYCLRMTSEVPAIHSKIKEDVVNSLVNKIIESDFMKIEYTEDRRERLGIIRAELRVVKIIK